MALRESVGWSTYALDLAEMVCAASVYAVCAVDSQGRAVGCVRVIGDGYYFYVQDVIVRPEHQSRGVGQRMMLRIEEWLMTQGPESLRGLICEPALVHWYQNFKYESSNQEYMVFHDDAKRISRSLD